MVITVFTPTYNRAYVLERLYTSLCNQTSRQFEWLVVDDGSTDNTGTMVSRWQDEKRIKIRYYYQDNAGKSAAHNKGVELAETELFVCVDSDDYLAENAMEEILTAWGRVKAGGIIGILAFKGYDDLTPMTKYSLERETTGRLLDLYRKGILGGDTMLVYETKYMKGISFPIFENEKFVPEAYLYDRLDEKGELYVLPHILYLAEYLEDGYTKNMSRLIADNPKGYLAWITQRLKKDTQMRYRTADLVRYIAVSIVNHSGKLIRDSGYPIETFLLYPIGWLFYRYRYHKWVMRKEKG